MSDRVISELAGFFDFVILAPIMAAHHISYAPTYEFDTLFGFVEHELNGGGWSRGAVSDKCYLVSMQ